MNMKFYEFYGAPITKFYSHFIAYLVFLGLYTYICLVRTPPLPSVSEILATAYVVTSLLEQLRQVCALEPSRFCQKLRVWSAESNWHLLDVGANLLFLLAATLRWDPSSRAAARVLYCTIINFFFIRILKFLAVSKYFGPVVAMMYRMVKNMLYFIVLLLVVLVSFGVCQQSIKFPNEDWHWRLLRHVFYQPYFMLYGEVYAPDIDPECEEECTEYGQCGEAVDGSLKVPCHPGRWVTPVAMTLYLLAANILILNLLIAVFNNIYQEVKVISNEVWNFQRWWLSGILLLIMIAQVLHSDGIRGEAHSAPATDNPQPCVSPVQVRLPSRSAILWCYHLRKNPDIIFWADFFSGIHLFVLLDCFLDFPICLTLASAFSGFFTGDCTAADLASSPGSSSSLTKMTWRGCVTLRRSALRVTSRKSRSAKM